MELSKAMLAGIVTLSMILSGAVVVTTQSSTFYCAPEDNVKECIRLSSTNKTCYYLKLETTVSDLCSNGQWKPITDYIKFPQAPDPNKLQNISINKPVLITNAQILEDLEGRQYIEGNCISVLK